MNSKFARFLEKLPKVDLHCHLVGAMRSSTVLSLASANGLEFPGKTPENLYSYSDFYEFIEVYRFCGAVLNTASDFERVAYEALEDAFRYGNGKHVEIAVNPSDFLSRGIRYRDMADGLVAGLSAASRDFGVGGLIIASIDREKSPSLAVDTVREVVSDRRDEIAGIGMDYAENKGAPSAFIEAYALAGKNGLHRTAHACEDYLTPDQAPPANVLDCLDRLGCDRIDHGYNMLFDEQVVSIVRERRIPLTCCVVTSDLRRRDRRLQTVGTMVSEGLNVTINTDDPAMFRTNLQHSWNELFSRFDWGPDQARKFSLAGVEASWLPADRKALLRDAFDKEISRLEVSLHSA